MIREIGETIGNTVVESVGRAVGRTQEGRPLPADLLESDDAFLAVFDAPGVERADVQVRFEDGEVRVRLDRFREFHEGFEMRFPGRGLSLSGSVPLPDGAPVRPSESTATLKRNGSLHVRVPKSERIEVRDEADETAVHVAGGHETADHDAGSEGDDIGVESRADDPDAADYDDGGAVDHGDDDGHGARGDDSTDQ
jgi:HSP20 family molecular chaperone IbpA